MTAALSPGAAPARGPAAVLEATRFQSLLDALARRGYRIIGPTLRDGAIVCGDVARVEDLPAGWTDEPEPGHYGLRRRSDRALFAYGVGAQDWKRFLHPPRVRLWEARRTGADIQFEHGPGPDPPAAFVGIRPCDLAAIDRLDRVLLLGRHPDPLYTARRQGLFIAAVNCTHPHPTCFCHAMETGPVASSGYDLAMTEFPGSPHCFVIEAGSEVGADVLRELECEPAGSDHVARADRAAAAAATHMGRSIDTEGLKDLLYSSPEHAVWDQVAERCLTCGNCTMVCPTCFCTTVHDSIDLTGERSERWRTWDSCHTLGFSYLHGGSARHSPSARYRQWLMHKLATWEDQFGAPGCVGCGRCIAWCPVGIDLTSEVAAIRRTGQERKHQQDSGPASRGRE